MDERIDQTCLDRLVDGQLPYDEYKGILASLDDEPGAWRRCAMTFLESQALAADLGAIRESTKLCPAPASVADAVARPTPMHQAATLLAIAASFLLAFCLGIVAPKFFSLARQDIGTAGNLNTSGGLAGGPSDTGNTGLPHQTLRPIGNVRLIMDGPSGETTEADNVPVYEIGQDLENYLSQDVPVLRPELIDLLKAQGYDVQHQQQFLPAPLDDGRQIIVPVDGYQITPVSRRY